MAGTKEKPCANCKWYNFEAWLMEKRDTCYLCTKSSEFLYESETKELLCENG